MIIDMKKLTILSLLTLLLLSCGDRNQKGAAPLNASDAASPVQLEQQAVMDFDKKVHDFQKIFSGEKVSYSFKFTNTGKAPLLISAVKSGCGCTVGDYTKDPVKPGDQGKITVVFNSSGRKGFQSQSVSVLNNSVESPVTLQITAEVIEQ
jgi:hypothetical protein